MSQEDKSLAPEDFESESVYSVVDQCSLPLKKKKNKAKSHSSCSKNRSEDANHLISEQMDFRQFDGAQISIANESITPYACFYGPSVKKLKAGWLDKLSPQGYGICGDYCVIAKIYVCMRDFGHCGGKKGTAFIARAQGFSSVFSILMICCYLS